MSGVARQALEKLCVIITIVLVYENALVFYQHLFPYWWSHGFYRQFFFNLIVGHWLVINTVMHYYFGITKSPGFVADLKIEKSTQDALGYTKCLKCGVMKPPRAHHCKVCQKCVVRYDHHCPWINNCVGYQNHVHFLLFCIYMAMIAAYATIVGQQEFQLVMFHDQILFRLLDPILRPYDITMAILEHETIGPITGVLTLFLFLANLVAMGLVLSLTIWQMSLITKGQTCVEEKIDKSIMINSVQQKQERPYDLGCKLNWTTFFETNRISALLIRLLIPFPFQPTHDGTKWISKYDK
ncbi:unnamed protein product [Rotaria magnacalcarata]|uniref:Palmitoyltransferase n=1 Tax=Rotaria magnacalcarata TaxID=392030 RepID=A0A816M569_9BILA|nr:unnamed protein product [Rotaria magnacalcarata]CAF2058124.1 unnamed protein product [Rotaria magnacalcarata]CAF3736071.1 unnamed protein product [Rotaria magnacalcarata]CAF3739323.1 unnamed protein product [Rotaria magnacalcarata]